MVLNAQCKLTAPLKACVCLFCVAALNEKPAWIRQKSQRSPLNDETRQRHVTKTLQTNTWWYTLLLLYLLLLTSSVPFWADKEKNGMHSAKWELAPVILKRIHASQSGIWFATALLYRLFRNLCAKFSVKQFVNMLKFS